MIETILFKIKAIIGALVISMTFSSPVVPVQIVQDTVQDEVQVVIVATSTATTTRQATSSVTVVIQRTPVTVIEEVVIPKQEAPVIEVATSTVSTSTLPTLNTEIVTSAPVYIPPTVQVVQVTAYVPQEEVATAPTPSQSMEQTYTIKKGDEVIASAQTEDQVRSFASDLNNYINWKKKMQSLPLKDVTKALNANGYDIPEIDTQD